MSRSLIALTLSMLGALFVVDAFSASLATIEQAERAGWHCDHRDIGGYKHCSAPSKPSLQELIDGEADPASVQMRVYAFRTGRFSGTETLRRADLFSGDENTPCTQDPGVNWVFLDFAGADYFACHRFDT